MVEALVRGDLDRWLWRPEHPADEEFHLAVTDLLASWASGYSAATEAVQIVGDRWSQRGLELRDLMSRFNVPFGFYDSESDGARTLLKDHGLDRPKLPVLVFGFRSDSPAFEDPSDQETSFPDVAVGIDLGTTYSLIAYVDAHGHPVCIPNSHGDSLTPSVVLFVFA